jgi:hypothetical protein
MGLVKVFILAIIFTLLQGRTVEKKKSANATSTHSLLVCSFFTKYLCWITLISSAWGFSKAYPIIFQSTWRKPEVFGRVKLEAFFSHDWHETDVKLWSDNCLLQKSDSCHRDERHMNWPLCQQFFNSFIQNSIWRRFDCRIDSDCPKSKYCLSWKCVLRQKGFCSNDSECSAQKWCNIKHVCVQKSWCDANSDCGLEKCCAKIDPLAQGRCLPLIKPGQFCLIEVSIYIQVSQWLSPRFQHTFRYFKSL